MGKDGTKASDRSAAAERRKKQNREAQRNFRARQKKKALEQRSSQLPPQPEKTTPTLDVSILERPSGRLKIEIQMQNLVQTLDDCFETVTQSTEDPSVKRYAVAVLIVIKEKIGKLYEACDFEDHHLFPNPNPNTIRSLSIFNDGLRDMLAPQSQETGHITGQSAYFETALQVGNTSISI